MRIGSFDIEHPLCLAPMEDVTDLPFRKLCSDFGAQVLFTEFANCEAVIRNIDSEISKFNIEKDARPIGIQLYGSNPESLEKAAHIASASYPDFIDLNCGCWVKKIAGRGDGAGLLRDLKRLEAAVQAVQRGSSVPVSVKTRLGWDKEQYVILELAPRLRDMGIQFLTVHCRTRVQGYRGDADWSWFPRIKEAAPDLPLIGNGDITTPKEAAACFSLGCDGVMIGRAAIQQPWVFRAMRSYLEDGVQLPEPTLDEQLDWCIAHLRAHVAFRGVPRGIYSFRRYYAAYLRGVTNIARLRRDLMQLMDTEAIVDRIRAFQSNRAEEDTASAEEDAPAL